MTRKEITLPSGATTTVRPLSAMDFMAAGVSTPNTTKAPSEAEAEEPTSEDKSFGFQIARLALLRGCGHFYDKGRLFQIVDKPHWKLERAKTHTEVCVEDVPLADANAIIDAVTELSGFRKEAAQAAESFPEGQETSGSPSPTGEDLRQVAH